MMAWRVARGQRRITIGGDKNYDTQQLVASLRAISKQHRTWPRTNTLVAPARLMNAPPDTMDTR